MPRGTIPLSVLACLKQMSDSFHAIQRSISSYTGTYNPGACQTGRRVVYPTDGRVFDNARSLHPCGYLDSPVGAESRRGRNGDAAFLLVRH